MPFAPQDIIVPRKYAEDWVEAALIVESHDPHTGILIASPLGGGPVYTFNPQRVDTYDFILVPPNVQKNPPHYERYFYAEWLDNNYRGWTTGHRWNGFSMPLFELSEAKRYAADSQKSEIGSSPTRYDPKKDAFITHIPEYDEPEIDKGFYIKVGTKKIKVYPIGSGSWTWTDAGPVHALDWYPDEEKTAEEE